MNIRICPTPAGTASGHSGPNSNSNSTSTRARPGSCTATSAADGSPSGPRRKTGGTIAVRTRTVTAAVSTTTFTRYLTRASRNSSSQQSRRFFDSLASERADAGAGPLADGDVTNGGEWELEPDDAPGRVGLDEVPGRGHAGDRPRPPVVLTRRYLEGEPDGAEHADPTGAPGRDVAVRRLDGGDRGAPVRPALRVGQHVPDSVDGRVNGSADEESATIGRPFDGVIGLANCEWHYQKG